MEDEVLTAEQKKELRGEVVKIVEEDAINQGLTPEQVEQAKKDVIKEIWKYHGRGDEYEDRKN